MVSYASEFYWNGDDVIYQRIGTERCSASGGFAWCMYLFKFQPIYMQRSNFRYYLLKKVLFAAAQIFVSHFLR